LKNKILNYIDSMPPLPNSLIEINKALSDPENGFDTLVKVINSDPILTTMVLNLINSAIFNLKREINNINQAIALLGVQEVARVSLSLIIKDFFEFNLSPYNMNEEKFKEINAININLAKQISKNGYNQLEEKLITTSYFIHIGKLLTSKVILENNLEQIFKQKINQNPIEEIEKELLGLSSLKTTVLILEYFNLNNISEIIKESIEIDQKDFESDLPYLIHLITYYCDNQINLPNENSKKYCKHFIEDNDLNEKILSII